VSAELEAGDGMSVITNTVPFRRGDASMGEILQRTIQLTTPKN
jgi:hypothetical protein